MIDAAVCIVYNDSTFLEECLESIRYFVRYVVFVMSTETWDGRVDDEGNQKVLAIIDEYLKNNNGYLIKRYSNGQADALNLGLYFCEKRDAKLVLIVDSDEIWDDQNKFNFQMYIEDNPDYEAYFVHAHTYFKSLRWRIDPPQNLKVLCLVKSYVRFKVARVAYIKKYKIIPRDLVTIHHPSHVRDDKIMYMKIKNCFERNNVKSNWYEDVWLKWTPLMENFHPTVPKEFSKVKEIKKEELPFILQKFLV